MDGSLPLPKPADRTATLSGAEGVLALPGPAGAGPFLVEAGAVRITGREREGIESIGIHGQDVVTNLSTTAGAAANVVATPGSLRRELVGPEGTTQEIVLALGTQPVAALQWQTSGTDERELSMQFTMGAGAAGSRYRVGEHAVVLRSGAQSDDHVVLLDPPPNAWTVVEAPGGGITVQVETSLTADRPVTLVAATVSERGPNLGTVMRHLDVHERRTQSPPWEDGGVHLATGVAELDDGVGWLAARIASAHGSGTQTPYELLWWGLGALASGQHEAALRAHDLLFEAASSDEGGPSQAHAALLAARIALTTGDTSLARAAAAESLDPDGPPRTPGEARLAAAASSALANALRYAAPEEQIEQLRRASDEFLRLASEGTGRRVLPMAGQEADADWLPPWLGAVIEGDPTAASASLIRTLADDHPEAYGAWRRSITNGLSDGPGGRGTWDHAGGGAPTAGALVCGLMHGLLGWDPDAPVGRLTLAPILPSHLTAFAIHNIQVGDARVSLEYRREGRHHTYLLTPTAGRVPPMLIFGPRIVATGVAEVLLDGLPAELNVRQTRDRAAVSVQIPLDGPRTLRLTAAEEG